VLNLGLIALIESGMSQNEQSQRERQEKNQRKDESPPPGYPG